MVRFKLELTWWARQAMLERPGTHGLVGVRDVDERVLDEALVKFDAGLRLFHLHAEGMGLVIIATATVAATLAGSPASRRPIIALLTVGGAGYPLGYLLWSGLIPYYGPDRGKTRSEEHTSELQSLAYLVCRLLLEKKKKKQTSGARVTDACVSPSRTVERKLW